MTLDWLRGLELVRTLELEEFRTRTWFRDDVVVTLPRPVVVVVVVKIASALHTAAPDGSVVVI